MFEADSDMPSSSVYASVSSDYSKGVFINECSFSRFSFSRSGMNAEIKNSHLGSISIMGGGDFTVENTHIYSNCALNLISDTSAFWNGDITLTGLNCDSVQGDRVIIDVLKKAGADVEVKSDYIRVRKSELKSFTFDAKDCPDLVPITAVLGAYAKGTTIIQNIERLKIKESDRIQSTTNMLSAFNIKAESDGKTLTVYGGKVEAGEVNSYNDHRIAMASAVLSLGAEGESVIYGAEAVNKSYPTFFFDLKKLGGKVNELL
jgi:3-phosphoshikimate 1-carboxyvinyltransferase